MRSAPKTNNATSTTPAPKRSERGGERTGDERAEHTAGVAQAS